MADLAIGGLNVEFRKKFDGHVFRNICELGTRVTKFESLMKEENQRKSSCIGTYYNDSNYCVNLDVDLALINKLLTLLCKNDNIPSEDDHIPANLEIDVAMVIGKKLIVCNPISKSNHFGQLLSSMSNQKNKEGVKRLYTFDISKVDDIFNY